MVIDCDSCAARDIACGDCVVAVLLRAPAVGPTLEEAEVAALVVLAEGGLVPPLRLVRGLADGSDAPPREAVG